MKKELIDKVQIKVIAGAGGDGAVSFRREKFIPKGGPDGGDGGHGGSVYFVVDHNMSTLMDFRSKTTYQAQDATPGGSRNKTGENGQDLFIKIPVGTLVYQVKNDENILLADMTGEDTASSELLVAHGGKGGKGNTRFKSSVNRTPYQYLPGVIGEQKDIILEVKLVADVGIIGLPNAGKSTLINALTNAGAKTAPYPFTTLMPNLGVMKVKDKSIVLADIPGLIEGASLGKGLGDMFLRHIERTRILLHVIDPLQELFADDTKILNGENLAQNCMRQYKLVRKELESYTGMSDLAKKPEIVVINKLDVTEIQQSLSVISKEFHALGVFVVGVSAISGLGLVELKKKLLLELSKHTGKIDFKDQVKKFKTFNLENIPNRQIIG